MWARVEESLVENVGEEGRGGEGREEGRGEEGAVVDISLLE